ncbi:MAG: uroporphyrinogen-III C-methyltransferase [Gammaproteobacteria bacterium]|nr:uroporphyrinogen-III C-methyltransferase [Gammaproteobacteria bacterium]
MKQKNSDNTVEVLSVETNAPQPAAGRRLLWLALLLLALLMAAGGAYLWTTIDGLRLELAALATHSAAPAGGVADVRVPAMLRSLQNVDQELAALNARLTQLDAQQHAAQASLDVIGSADKRDWALAEVEYLLRLANQSLLMGREVRGALALLDAADEILRKQDDPALHEVRAALARDRASLEAVAGFDVEGLYLRLSALGAQLPMLVVEERSLAQAREASPVAPASDADPRWWTRVRLLLDRYIVVRQRQPVKPLMPLAEEQYLRVNQRLALEQAKLALLATEPAVYRGALQEAAALTRAYFSAEVAANQAFLGELTRLAEVDIAPVLPDISGSLRALRERNTADEG